jgi:SAM-dependent methyltransferase
VRRPKLIGDRLGRHVDAHLKRRPGRLRSSDWYDDMFARKDEYGVPYNFSPYYFVWTVIADRLRQAGVSRVLEIGCGSGQLAALLLEHGVREYHGFDFSANAIELARSAAPEGNFWVADALDGLPEASASSWDVVICTEVLEHVEGDLRVVAGIPVGCRSILSVPSYDSKGHVRYFSDAARVVDRYGGFFSDLDVATFPTAGSSTHKIFLADGHRNEMRLPTTRPTDA